MQSKGFEQSVQDFTSAQGINWSFIPPSAPHFGGLWESGVKSVKFHLRRVVGGIILTFEEYYTILTPVSYTHLDVYKRQGRKHPVRILFDSGSQANFCPMRFARRMGLKLIKSQLPITGIYNSLSQADFSTTVRLHSRYKNFNLNIHCAVLPSITNNLPAESFDISSLNLPKGIFLADPQLNFSSQIDILLGAQYYLQLIEPVKFIRSPYFPIIQERCV